MTFKKLFCGVATIFFVAGNVTAADRSDEWEIRLTPYLWAMAVDGTSQIGVLPPADIDASFGDILDNLNMALSLHTEFAKGRWTFVIDPTYVDLQIDSAISSTIPQADVGLEITIWLVELWSSYEVTDHWELLGGLRWQSQSIGADGTVFNMPLDVEVADEDWTDFFVGVRASYELSEKWLFTARVDAVLERLGRKVH